MRLARTEDFALGAHQDDPPAATMIRLRWTSSRSNWTALHALGELGGGVFRAAWHPAVIAASVRKCTPRPVVRPLARSVPSLAVPWERLQGRSEEFLECHRVLLQMRARPQNLDALLRDQQLPRKKDGADEQARLLH